MPNRIRKMPNKELWKVYGKSGVPFSNKGLSKKMAEKQLVAVNLSELRAKGRLPPRMVQMRK